MSGAPWALVLHAPYEGPGLVEEVGAGLGVEFRPVRTYVGDYMPAWRDIGGVVSMGGPMSVRDAGAMPVLESEMGLLWVAVDQGLPVLGICLGSQLLAASFGASVGTGAQPEIGCGEVQLTPEGLIDPVLGPAGLKVPVFQWHQDTFSVPREGVRLAESSLFRNQAFRISRRAYGFQFHIEITAELVEGYAPYLPDGVTITDDEREKIAGVGRQVLTRFFEVALS